MLWPLDETSGPRALRTPSRKQAAREGPTREGRPGQESQLASFSPFQKKTQQKRKKAEKKKKRKIQETQKHMENIFLGSLAYLGIAKIGLSQFECKENFPKRKSASFYLNLNRKGARRNLGKKPQGEKFHE